MNNTYLFSDNIHKALDIAFENKNILVHPEHFVMALLSKDDSILNKALRYLKIDLQYAKVSVQEKIFKLLQPTKKFNIEHVKMSEELFNTIELAKLEQTKNQDVYLGLDIWIIANIELINSYFKFDKEKLIKTLKIFRGSKKILTASFSEENPTLFKYCTNLNKNVSEGKISKTIGREKELNRLMKLLLRKDKNTPLIIGEQGVGKTNLINGLSYNIVNGDVPLSLLNKIILSLDIGDLNAGAVHQGELEDRLKTILEEIKNSKEIILFIDNIHNILKNEDLVMILKPYLNRNEINLIGTTTNSDYKLYIESDNGLKSRFQNIKIEEPTIIEAVQIMKGIKNNLEIHHDIVIQDDALLSAVELSKRYITNKRLPEKAIDIIDEAAAELKMDIETEPYILFEMKNKLNTLKIEREHEKDLSTLDPGLNPNYIKLDKDIDKLTKKLSKAIEQYKKEKETFFNITTLKNEINILRKSFDENKKNENIKEASNIQEEINTKENNLKNLNKKWDKLTEKDKILKNSVDVDLVSKVISNWSGIPLSKMQESEMEKILNMPEILSKKVIGQDEVVNSISKIVQKNKAGLSDEFKPIGSFMFLGTSGVGKTYVAKQLAKFLFNDASKMIRFDMSEYQNKSMITRLTGAAPGLVGYDEGGQLTEAVKNNPYSVILFDEVEKAHPDIFNLLLQVLDDGRLTDNKGVTVNFKNTIIILTSNIGSSKILEVQEKKALKAAIDTELRGFFRPEFLNRLDDLIIFNPLSIENLVKISALLLNDVQDKLNRRQITLKVDEEVKRFIAEEDYNPLFGARPLRRAISENIEDVLTTNLLNGSLKEGQTITFFLNEEKKVVSKIK